MSITVSLRNLFYLIFSGQGPNRERDFEIILNRYFPPNPQQSKIAAYRELEILPQINTSYETCNKVDETFKRDLIRAQENANHSPELETFKSELQHLFGEIANSGNFLSLENLRNKVEETKSLAGILALGALVGIHPNLEIHTINDLGYFVPNDVTKKQVEDCISSAKKQATHYGSVFPYDKLDKIPEWKIIPKEHRKRFAKELLSSISGFLELGDKDFFGFSNVKKDRVLSRLIKIYSVYEEVPIEIVVATIQRTLKRMVTDKSLLEECAEIYDEYCLTMGYCLEKDGYLFTASPTLQELIKQEPLSSDDTMYSAEKKLVSALRKNGAPMDTKSFMPAIKECQADRSYVMKFATLLYREGWHKNSIYYTLDDRYEEKFTGDTQESQFVGRKKIAINRINRDSRLSRRIKRLCENNCQICGERIQIGEDKYYSEVHHVQPLGQPHNGKDEQNNMLCVCPNHHVMLDYGVIPLTTTDLFFQDVNPLADKYINYHNQNIFRNQE
jgi:hypothetical protein